MDLTSALTGRSDRGRLVKNLNVSPGTQVTIKFSSHGYMAVAKFESQNGIFIETNYLNLSNTN